MTEEVTTILDVRPRRRLFALTENERRLLIELIGDELRNAEHARDRVKQMGSLRGALRWDASVVKLKNLMEIFK